MDASKALISQIFSRGRLLEIPFYQRAYVWGEEQWSRLLDDMEFVSKSKRNYFMGSVILKQDTVPSTCVYSDKRIIIDGQQRMTTIMIFLKVMLLLEDNNKLFDRNYRLEHMMPKKWRNNWTPCASQDLAKARDNKLLTLGNLAIIPQSLNSAIRDSSWDIKKAGKPDKPGLSKCAAGITTMHDALQKDEWNEAEIDARAEWLFEQAAALWKVK